MRCLTRSWPRSAANAMATAVVAMGAYAGGAGASHTDPFAFFDRLVVLGDADWKRLDGGDGNPAFFGPAGDGRSRRADADAGDLDAIRDCRAGSCGLKLA